jgi:hypothetical protein
VAADQALFIGLATGGTKQCLPAYGHSRGKFNEIPSIHCRTTITFSHDPFPVFFYFLMLKDRPF